MVDQDRVSDPVGSAAVLTVALVFFLIGCTLLVTSGATLGAVHAFAAFIVLAIVAASNQLVPVLTGAPTARPRAVIGVSSPLAIGFALLVAGFLSSPLLLPSGAALLVAGVVAWVVWTLKRLLQGRRESETRVVIAISSFALLAAASIGGAMAFALGGALSPDVLRLAPAHALVAIVLFASVLIAVVSRRLIPMFALAHARETVSGRVVPWLLAAAGSGAGVAISMGAVTLLRATLVLALATVVVAMRSHEQTIRVRLRRRLDISLWYAVVAWTFAFVAALLALGAAWSGALGTAAVACAVLGWLNLSVIGYAYKIAGFLAWQFAKSKAPDAALPALASTMPSRSAQVSLTLLAIGTVAATLCLAASLPFQEEAFVLYAAGGYIGAIALLTIPVTYLRGSSKCRTMQSPSMSSASMSAGSTRPSRWSSS